MPCPKCGNWIENGGCRRCGPLPKYPRAVGPFQFQLQQQEMQFEEIVYRKKDSLRLKVTGREEIQGKEFLICKPPRGGIVKIQEENVVRL